MKRIRTVTASAFIFDREKVLIVRRAMTEKFLPGEFELPGGHIEFGESVEEGLGREVKEELNVGIKLGSPFHVFNNAEHCVEIDYFARLKKGRSIKLNPKEHSEYKWVSEVEVAENFGPDDEVGKAISKGFEILKKMK